MKILKKEILTDALGSRVARLEIEAPLIASKARPGQFVVLMVKKEGERIPLTVAASDEKEGRITLIFQELGLTTKLLGKAEEGDSLYSLVGPLGHATEIKKYGSVILIGGGVGIAEVYPVAKAMSAVAGNKVITIIGARTKGLLILEEELRAVSSELHVATDDGSYGTKGFVTDILAYSLKLKAYSLVYAVGPIPMMKAVANATKNSGIKTTVSLNALMVDGTGMCGSCRVTVDGKVKFSCVDGPEFDAHLVDWDELDKRSRIYVEKEKHICKLSKL
ncbi:MAG: sulfide/dihydroorotate dehydrogenase-like FAD/NAD-binding protein [Candidatus Omnitrophica bacterium]|nr:sulfide/dihydroorotate dehydrogenase-like FAD/NAD-binding protein [Candidatus Omnitrophota bacterium]